MTDTLNEDEKTLLELLQRFIAYSAAAPDESERQQYDHCIFGIELSAAALQLESVAKLAIQHRKAAKLEHTA